MSEQGVVTISSSTLVSILLSFLVIILWLISRSSSREAFSAVDVVFILVIAIIFLVDWEGAYNSPYKQSPPRTYSECITYIGNEAYNCAMTNTCDFEEQYMKGWQYCNDRCLKKDLFHGGLCE